MSCYNWFWSKKSLIHFLLKLLIVITALSALCLYMHVYICHRFSYYNSKFWFSHVNGSGHAKFQQPICELEEENLDKFETLKARGFTTWLRRILTHMTWWCKLVHSWHGVFELWSLLTKLKFFIHPQQQDKDL
jgi:hypothetical protein